MGITLAYKGWKKREDPVGNTSFRSGASPGNLFPKTRQGCLLDAELLKKIGLTQARMANEDADFSYSFCFRCVTWPNLELMGIGDARTTSK